MPSRNAEKWKIVHFVGTGVHVDLKKHEIMHNPKRSWIRFETSNLIHIYLHSERGSSKTGESNATKRKKSDNEGTA